MAEIKVEKEESNEMDI